MTKAKGNRSSRIRHRAEVFTPSWICNIQNSLTDQMWFGRADVFGKADGKSWTPTDKKIKFPGRPGRSWQDYVRARRLEITCGEAPYLASRYDTVSGIPLTDVRERIGLLDRKLRVVTENTNNEYDWFDWAVKAYKSIYGYEYQGDNLLLARANLLFTFSDWFKHCWGREPSLSQQKKIAIIISWNIWQMDGLSYTAPYSGSGPDDGIPCVIRTASGRRLTLKPGDEKRRGSGRIFGAIVGNPPYQEEAALKKDATNGQAPRRSIFQHFQTSADRLSSEFSVLIYPGARWIHRSGKGMDRFGFEQINDSALERLELYADSKELFADVDLADGISVVCKNRNKRTLGFTYVYHGKDKTILLKADNPGEELMPLDPRDRAVISKADRFVKRRRLSYLHERVLPRNLFGIESSFLADSPNLVKPYYEDIPLEPEEIKLFTNDRAGKAGRATWFVTSRDVIPASKQEYISQWQVVVSSANAGGQKRDNQIEIIDDRSAFGRSRVALGTFETEQEAENFFAYANTYLVRFLFLMTDEALTSLGKKVPDLGDYSSLRPLLDFSKSLDNQLYALLGLNDEDIEHIEKTVSERRKKGSVLNE